MEAQSIRALVEEALDEVVSEKAIAVRPVIGPIEQFEHEERYRIQVLDSRFGEITVPTKSGCSLKDVIKQAIASRILKIDAAS
jgi:metal-sulfur cluster biosynthetic enzyme